MSECYGAKDMASFRKSLALILKAGLVIVIRTSAVTAVSCGLLSAYLAANALFQHMPEQCPEESEWTMNQVLLMRPAVWLGSHAVI